jgi:uncharacterized MAPEG superfamily protein
VRALRAPDNMAEDIVAVLVLALLSLALEPLNPVLPIAGRSLAVTGAAVFVLARRVCQPQYLMAVPFLRSLVCGIGFTGQVLMVLALV